MVRVLILVSLAWLALAASPPPRKERASIQGQRSTEITNALNGVAAAIQNRAEAPVSNPPCNAGEDNRESDLCAQWKAADAAASSRTATWIFGALGCLIGGLTLAAAFSAARWAKAAAEHTETGADEARRAANAAEETIRTSKAELRPWLAVEGRVTRFVAEGNVLRLEYEATVTNLGKTVALGVASQIKHVFMSDKAVAFVREYFAEAGKKYHSDGGTLIPGESIRLVGAVVQAIDAMPWSGEGPNECLQSVLLVSVQYRDPINEREWHWTERSFVFGRSGRNWFERTILMRADLDSIGADDLIVNPFVTGRTT